MKKKYRFITLKKNYSKYLAKIIRFYAPYYKRHFTKETVLNSAVICLAFEEDKIIGAVRAVSDLTRHAMIVDLIVDENYRGQKVGTKLLLLIASELKKYNCYIGLTTDPSTPWLIDFYKKNGFETVEGCFYLELKH